MRKQTQTPTYTKLKQPKTKTTEKPKTKHSKPNLTNHQKHQETSNKNRRIANVTTTTSKSIITNQQTRKHQTVQTTVQ